MTTEYHFRREVLPVIAFGTLLNLVPAYVRNEVLHLPFPFVDMAGTIFAALLLGPWWAACVGVAGSAISGSFLGFYFPFVVANVAGGVVCGYLARSTRLGESLCRPAIKLLDRTRSFVILGVAVSLTCGIISTLVHVALQVPISFDSDVRQVSRAILETIGLRGGADELCLLLRDTGREFADKPIVLLLALIFVAAFKFAPVGLWSRWNAVKVLPVIERLRTEWHSIVVFMVFYSGSLLVALIYVPVISFSAATPPLRWLQSWPMLALLLGPVLTALAAFVFLTYRNDRSLAGRIVRTQALLRGMYYRQFRRPQPLAPSAIGESEIALFFKRDNLYGILATVALWPSNPLVAKLGWSIPFVVYLMVVAAFAFVFFYNYRRNNERLCEGARLSASVHTWLSVEDISNSSAVKMLSSFASAMECYYSTREVRIRSHGEVLSSSVGIDLDMRGDATFEATELIVGAKTRELTPDVRTSVDHLVERRTCKAAIILTSTAIPYQADIAKWLRRYFTPGKPIRMLLLTWHDLERCVEACVRKEELGPVLSEIALRTEDILLHAVDESETWKLNDLDSLILRQRALPSIKHILERLPPNNFVVDLGAGRGRHTLCALHAGHRVFAVERDPEMCGELKDRVRAERKGGRAKVLQGDCFGVAPDNIGDCSLIICTGVLHYSKSAEELTKRLRYLRGLFYRSSSLLCLEMLFERRCDDSPAAGCIWMTQVEFEEMMRVTFPDDRIERLAGPISRIQRFPEAGRSFLSQARKVESIICEYLIRCKD